MEAIKKVDGVEIKSRKLRLRWGENAPTTPEVDDFHRAPERFKTRPCYEVFKGMACPRGDCPYAHAQSEIRHPRDEEKEKPVDPRDLVVRVHIPIEKFQGDSEEAKQKAAYTGILGVVDSQPVSEPVLTSLVSSGSIFSFAPERERSVRQRIMAGSPQRPAWPLEFWVPQFAQRGPSLSTRPKLLRPPELFFASSARAWGVERPGHHEEGELPLAAAGPGRPGRGAGAAAPHREAQGADPVERFFCFVFFFVRSARYCEFP